MRELIIITVILFSGVVSSNAQIKPGRYLIGGGLNIYNAKYVQPLPVAEVDYLSTNIQLGRVVKENTVVGVNFSLANGKNHYSDLPDSNYSSTNAYSAGLFYRKYKKLAKDFYFFAEVNASYDYSKNDQKQYFQGITTGSHSISNGGSAAFIPGISYAVCKRMQMDLLIPNLFTISYAHRKTDYTSSNLPQKPTEKGNVFSLNTNLNSGLLSSFGIGFKFFIGK